MICIIKGLVFIFDAYFVIHIKQTILAACSYVIYAIFRQTLPSPVKFESNQIVHHPIDLDGCMQIQVELVQIKLGKVGLEEVEEAVDHIRPGPETRLPNSLCTSLSIPFPLKYIVYRRLGRRLVS